MTRVASEYVCTVCTAPFLATQPAKYCTAACQQKACRQRNPKVHQRPCALCGAPFDGTNRSVRYCSDEHRREGSRILLRQRRAAANPHWTASCIHCGSAFETNTQKKKFCAEDCRTWWHYLNGQGARRQRIEDWYAADPEGVRFARAEWGQRQRARKAGSTDSVAITRRDWERMLRRHDYRCAYCKEKAPLQKDHVVPIARGGRHSIGNVLPACARCNAVKKAKFLSVWRHKGAPYARPSDLAALAEDWAGKQ